MGDNRGDGVFLGVEADLQDRSQTPAENYWPKAPQDQTISPQVSFPLHVPPSPLLTVDHFRVYNCSIEFPFSFTFRRHLRRTRAIFDVAVTVHKNIQQRDLEAGRSLGNWFLRFLDRIKPSAQIRSSPEKLPVSTLELNSNKSVGVDKPTDKMSDQIDENWRLFTSFNKNSLPLPTIMMMKPTKQAQNLHFSSQSVQNFSSFLSCGRGQYNDVIRRDIALWMHLK
ncbi:hypothetical protein KFK09_000087 [Dendrobium nobile]|uniref:Uncharacterized protein n=1 Tax=Dendrobium nobile TaxID=94219 RepID=A0A8T3CDP4_DENNO|nr:hypothetical protein KFK09_000087 [Dendrobium nobile]